MCASCTIHNITEPLRNVMEHYGSVMERYRSVTEPLWNTAGHYRSVTEQCRELQDAMEHNKMLRNFMELLCNVGNGTIMERYRSTVEALWGIVECYRTLQRIAGCYRTLQKQCRSLRNVTGVLLWNVTKPLLKISILPITN